MAKYQIQTTHTRVQRIAGTTPAQFQSLRYPAGSVIEPTNAEYQAFQDVLVRVDDSTPVTPAAEEQPETASDAPYTPAGEPPPPPAEPPPPEGEGTPTRRR